jgi:flagellar biosynthesis protein FlhG
VTTLIKDRLKEFATESDWKSRVTQNSKKEIWSIGGGKGGVGKSLTTANLSICLALMGHKVVSVDLDLGGANLHTCLGANIPALTLSDFLTKKVSNFDDLITPTPIDNLSIISGAHDDFGMANLKQTHKAKILHQLYEMDADFILLDLGAGTTYNTLDFFLAADKGVMTTLPEPTSIENTYRFIKSVFHRKLSLCDELLDVTHLIDQAMNSKITGESNPSKMIKEISVKYPDLGKIIESEILDFIPNLIINQTRTQSDIDIGFSMKFICQKYFGFSLDYLGYLEHDPSVWQSVKKRKPLLTEFPNSPLINNFESIVQKLLPKNSYEKTQEQVG